MSILGKIFGGLAASNEKVIEELRPIVEEINFLEKDYEKLSDEELKNKTEEFRKRLNDGESLDGILPEAFAAVREASKRTLGQRHFDVQLMGGIVLHRGQISEMKTGEGKTLVATLPAYLNALTGNGVHVVTVNDYLARRDVAWMGQIYNALGFSVGVLNHEASYLYDESHRTLPPQSPPYQGGDKGEVELDQERDTLGAFKVVHEFLRPVKRHEAYFADITYGTNNEYGFDYLRDNMVVVEDQISQRKGPASTSASLGGHSFAIVDEVDSILIDEARTPLIISAPDMESGELYKTFAKIAPKLQENVDYNVDEKMKTATITEPGIEKVENLLGIKDIYTEKGIKYVHHLEQALKAKELFILDRDYVVKNGEVIIVDEFTGRLMPGRRWSEGLHQAIEAKEDVQVQKESRTLATITFQNYFRLYKKLSGMTGTASTSAEEFHKVYKLEVVQIPTNRQMVRSDLPDKVFQTENGKFKALIREIKERNKKGQPVLVGTVSIEKNEKLAAMLQREGLQHKVLNAKHHEEEGAIIAQAGRFGAITVATNMAGRGVDIILGGNPPNLEEAQRVKEAGGLLIIGTERHEARRIDDQLRGRAGRQGDPGESQFYVSMEDSLMRIFGSERIKNLMGRFGIPEDEPIENKMVSNAIESAQGKIEGFNFDARKHILEYDDVMNKQRTAIYERRRKILLGANEEVEKTALEVLKNTLNNVIAIHAPSDYAEDWNKKEIEENIKSFLGDGYLPVEELNKKISEAQSKNELLELINNFIDNAFLAKKELFASQSFGEGGANNFLDQARMLMLQATDVLWMEHIEAMEHMRSSVGLRAYGQRDPLVEYKNEGARMFNLLQQNIDGYIANLILKIGSQSQPAAQNVKSSASNISKNDKLTEIGRNVPCWCGSGKKYKKCHGK